ncbi:MAG: Dihydrolipoamide acyltransferase component of branched-chain alpha-keto acid dehydrogenase complex, partial [uncultured Blastococcus sp.]
RDAVGAQGQGGPPAGDATGAVLRPPDHRRRAGLPLPGRHRRAPARSGGGAGVL